MNFNRPMAPGMMNKTNKIAELKKMYESRTDAPAERRETVATNEQKKSEHKAKIAKYEAAAAQSNQGAPSQAQSHLGASMKQQGFKENQPMFQQATSQVSSYAPPQPSTFDAKPSGMGQSFGIPPPVMPQPPQLSTPLDAAVPQQHYYDHQYGAQDSGMAQQSYGDSTGVPPQMYNYDSQQSGASQPGLSAQSYGSQLGDTQQAPLSGYQQDGQSFGGSQYLPPAETQSFSQTSSNIPTPPPPISLHQQPLGSESSFPNLSVNPPSLSGVTQSTLPSAPVFGLGDSSMQQTGYDDTYASGSITGNVPMNPPSYPSTGQSVGDASVPQYPGMSGYMASAQMDVPGYGSNSQAYLSGSAGSYQVPPYGMGGGDAQSMGGMGAQYGDPSYASGGYSQEFFGGGIGNPQYYQGSEQYQQQGTASYDPHSMYGGQQ